ncbi:MAG: hypothetical protein CME13_14315 [Gemmatimonadetes bacterium]|jgi:hypothetical protein|nr:hypothetical protein [Gemmatimonadota bacterium]|tara:strand:+ start:640 stop:975 length:336 start_codon:yes stop_codon:yes gene_type:complete
MVLVNALDEGLQLGRPMGKHHIRLIDPIEALLLGAQIADDRRTTDAFEKMLKVQSVLSVDRRYDRQFSGCAETCRWGDNSCNHPAQSRISLSYPMRMTQQPTREDSNGQLL